MYISVLARTLRREKTYRDFVEFDLSTDETAAGGGPAG
jgi:hypothetical protein